MKTEMLRNVGLGMLAVLVAQVLLSAAPTSQQQNDKITGEVRLLATANIPPEVQILLPPPGVGFWVGSPIQVRASASDSDGRIKEVRFYNRTNLIGTATNSPYEIVWSDWTDRVCCGGNTVDPIFTAVAVNDFGATTTSKPVKDCYFEFNFGGYISLTIVDARGYYVVPGGTLVGGTPGISEFRAVLEHSDGAGNPVDFTWARTNSPRFYRAKVFTFEQMLP